MINKVTLIGRLGNDPELRHLDGGTAVCRLSLATSDSYKDRDGNWQETTEWHNVVVWRDLAERCGKLKKGTLIFVEGKIQYRKYEKDGVERTATDIVAATVRSLEKLPKADETANQEPAAKPQPTSAEQASGAAYRQKFFGNTPPQADADLPF